MIEVAVRNILTGNAALKALVADRVYFNVRPQDEYRPSVVMYLVSATPAFTFSGRGGFVEGRLQLNCMGSTYPQAKAVAQAVRNAVDGFSGMNDMTTIARLETDNMRDFAAVPQQGAGVPATFVTAIDVFFAHYE